MNLQLVVNYICQAGTELPSAILSLKIFCWGLETMSESKLRRYRKRQNVVSTDDSFSSAITYLPSSCQMSLVGG